MTRTGPTLSKIESGFHVALPAEHAVDADDWLSTLASHGVKSVDFLLHTASGGASHRLQFIEFKSSMPAPDGQAQSPGALKERCQEIVGKVERTAGAILALSAGRSLGAVSLTQWMTPEVCRGHWQVVLVVTGARREWLEPVRNQLRESLRAVARALGLDVDPKVVDAAMAEKLGLGRTAKASPATGP